MTALLPPGPGEFDEGVDEWAAQYAERTRAARAAFCADGRHYFRREEQAWQCEVCPERRPFGGPS